MRFLLIVSVSLDHISPEVKSHDAPRPTLKNRNIHAESSIHALTPSCVAVSHPSSTASSSACALS